MTAVLSASRPTDAPDLPSDRRVGAAEVLVLLIGTVVGFAFLGHSSLHLDESVAATLATAPWHAFAHTVTHREANMSGYYLLLRGWVAVTGRSEFALRTLSVLFSLGVIALVMLIGRRLFSRRAGILAGLLLAVDPIGVQFAQFARGYELSLLLATASSALFLAALRRPGRLGLWVAYVAVTAAAAYTNFWAALVPLAQLVSLVPLAPGEVPWRRVVGSELAAAVLMAPVALLIKATDNSGVNWVSQASAGHLFTRIRAAVPHALIDLAVLAGVAVVAAGLVVWRRRRPLRPGGTAWSWLFCAAWLVVPIGSIVLVSAAYRPLLVARYLVVCLPPVMLLVGAGLDRLRRPALVVATALLVAISAVGVAQWYRHGPGQDWRGVTAAVARQARPGDGVLLFAPYVRIPFEWYLQDHPTARAELRPVVPATAWGADPLYFDTAITLDTAEVRRAAEGYGRVWLVLSQQAFSPGEYADVLAGLRQAGLRPVHTEHFAGVDLVEYRPGAGAGS